MNSNIRAIIFDLDGVLIDTEPLWVKAYTLWLKNHKLKNDPVVYKLMIGRGLKENMILAKKHLGIRGDIQDLLRDLRGIMYNLISQKKDILMPGVKELLPKLATFKLAVATGGHTKMGAGKILARVGIKNYFDTVVSSDDVKLGKPAPDVYLEVARLIGEKVENCLVIEDSVNGVESGKAAGMTVIGINKGLPDRSELTNWGADSVFSTLKQFKL
jgi:HAD superfamily hydrolase (TIGR01509 family)